MRINFGDKKVKILLHASLWAAIFSLPFILYKSDRRPPDGTPTNEERINFLYFSIFTNVMWVALFYFNGLKLMKHYYANKRWGLYIASIILLFIGTIGLHYLLFKLFIGDHPYNLFRGITFTLPPFILSLAASALWQLWGQRHLEEAILQQQKEENLKTELSFLRSQISPHFIFNILNNITALIRLKSDQAEPTIIQLSGLMQYMLYDVNQEQVQLKTELDYLLTYINLQKQRYGERVSIITDITQENEWAMIEPMLLIPFVENAFKHGVGYIDQPSIHIHLKTTNQQLGFSVINKYNPASQEMKDKTSGIGLSNVQRRIELLYGNQGSLTIHRSGQLFTVNLTLELHTNEQQPHELSRNR